MKETKFDYKGKKIVIKQDDGHATVSVDGREFGCHFEEAKEKQGLSMWMCDEAYFTTPDLRELARHFADYGYMFDDPGRVVVDDDGKVVAKGGKKPGGKKPAHDHDH